MRPYSDSILKHLFRSARSRGFPLRTFSALTRLNQPGPLNTSLNRFTRSQFTTLALNSDPLSLPFSSNVVKLTNYDDYHKIVYRPLDSETVSLADLVVSVFYNKQSTASLSVLESVNKLARDFPDNTFLLVDSDRVPRSAYDADVQHFPSALLSYGGDLYRDLVSEEPGFPKDWSNAYKWTYGGEEPQAAASKGCVLPSKFYDSVVKALKKFSSYDGRNVSAITSKAGTHSYTHGIDTDNLNLKRVGWPTE